ncbi:flagellin [Clostridium botulinum]|uniref:flagellin N-terminal helical domain-containing protein n=1 Tax=Clostridium botulinum TaxID=1491 RepID=UPI0013F0DD0E|nr:flagellin [Clostridium botulinum]NFL04195.1 flagellin [Clostridium botulinum]QPW59608.1 flagellin [Clostridium botulinum]
MIINHNMNAMNAHRQMGMNTVNTGKAMEKLSSGLRINRAGDDAAGLAISEKMRGQIRGLNQASRNSQDGISLIQTAEGALNETHSILQRMRELSVQASNDTNTTDDRGQLQKEINQLTSEVNRIANTTEFNTQKILNSKDGKNFELQIGANEGQSMTVKMDDMTSGALKITDDKNKKYVGGEIKDLTIKTADDKGTAKELTIKVADQVISLAKIPDKTKAEIQVTKNEIIDKINAGLTTAKVNLTASIEDGKLVLKGTDATNAVKATEIKNADGGIGDFGTPADKGFANEITNGTDNTGISSALDVSTHENAAKAITKFDDALNKVSDQRSRLGAYQNRLEHTINNLNTSSENLQASESRIRDVDMAKEMMNFSKNNILAQAAQAMLAQANQQPQGVLQLLR